MQLYYERYHRKHLQSCAEIIRTTWKFEKRLIRPKHPELLYQYYILDCENWSEHLDLLVDVEGTVWGILFGSIEAAPMRLRLKYLCKQLRNELFIRWHILLGHLGQRRAAFAAVRNIQDTNQLGETTERAFDSEINLFILRPGLRGQGYGRQLMDRYIQFCRQHKLRDAFLWTTIDCTYRFYENYGYRLYKTFRYDSGKEAGAEPNGMIYYLPISQ